MDFVSDGMVLEDNLSVMSDIYSTSEAFSQDRSNQFALDPSLSLEQWSSKDSNSMTEEASPLVSPTNESVTDSVDSQTSSLSDFQIPEKFENLPATNLWKKMVKFGPEVQEKFEILIENHSQISEALFLGCRKSDLTAYLSDSLRVRGAGRSQSYQDLNDRLIRWLIKKISQNLENPPMWARKISEKLKKGKKLSKKEKWFPFPNRKDLTHKAQSIIKVEKKNKTIEVPQGDTKGYLDKFVKREYFDLRDIVEYISQQRQ